MNAPVMVDVGDETDPLEVSCTLCEPSVLSLSGSHTAFAQCAFARASNSLGAPTCGGKVCKLADGVLKACMLVPRPPHCTPHGATPPHQPPTAKKFLVVLS
jgi:hypothetical protein